MQHYAIAPDISWPAGVSDSIRRVRSNSGFNLTIADAQSTATLISQINSWIQHNEDALMALGTAGASGTVDIGVTVETSDQFNASIVLTPQELTPLSGFGLTLSVSAYPASDP